MVVNRSLAVRPHIYFIVLLLTYLFFLPAAGSCQEPPLGVISAAETGLPRFLSSLPANSAETYGLVQGDLDASLGTPFLLHTIPNTAIATYRLGDPVAAALIPTSMWYVPVLKGGETKALLVVDFHEGAWKAVAFGFGRLAPSIGAALRAAPPEQGFHPKFVSVFSANQFFVSIPEKSPFHLESITPGASDNPATGPTAAGGAVPAMKPLQPASPESAMQTISKIREAITVHLQ